MTVDSAPSFTYSFRYARKHLSRVLDEFVSSYTVFLGAADKLVSEVKPKLGGFPGDL